MPGIRSALLTFSLVLALGLLASEPGAPEDAGVKLIANAVNLGTSDRLRSGQTGSVLIRVDRWSTPEERQALADAFRQKGAPGLLTALRKTPSVGVLRTPDRVGWELHYAAQMPDENGGRRIFLGTDRPLSFAESSRDLKASDYPFTLVELRLDARSKGEGRMSLGTKISLGPDGQNIRLESYGSEPVRLQDVRPDK